jgi:hypothetical protein
MCVIYLVFACLDWLEVNYGHFTIQDTWKGLFYYGRPEVNTAGLGVKTVNQASI